MGAYRFAVEAESYEDLGSGRVLRSAPGHMAFPVRLARGSRFFPRTTRTMATLRTYRQEVSHRLYDRKRQLKIGKRRITWLVRGGGG